MGVDKHNLALVLVIGIVLIGLFILLSFGRGKFAGEATFTGIEPEGCDEQNPCSQVGFVCETISGSPRICVPSNRNVDTDKDGLKDYDEIVFYGTDYLLMDTDADGLIDSREAVVWEAGQSVDDSSSLVITLTSSLRRLFGVE